MAPRDSSRVRPRRALVIAVAVLALAAVAATGGLWSRGSLNELICGGDCGAAYVEPPASLKLRPTPASANIGSSREVRPQAAKIEAAVQRVLTAPALGNRVGFAAVSSDGAVLARQGGVFVPASTTKLLTAYAALTAIDPQHRFTTRVVREGNRITLVGGGDPYLAEKKPSKPIYGVRADLATLADKTARKLKKSGQESVELNYDESLFSGPAISPAWEPHYVPQNIVTPISALWADQGTTNGIRSRNPAAAATAKFADLLTERGIAVRGTAGERTPVRQPAKAGTSIASVKSGTVAQIVDRVLLYSDNEAAEVLFRHVGLAAGKSGSFEGGAAAVEQILKEAALTVEGLRLDDGSGLARSNRISPLTLALLVADAAQRDRTALILTDLPVAGLNGTLSRRFDESPARGLVRAKTGTLTGVHSLAGITTDADGALVAFAVMTDRTKDINAFSTQQAIDAVATAIATCHCGG